MARPSKLGLHRSETTGDLLADFHERVMCEPMSGCWLWIGDCTVRGYGRFRAKPGDKQMLAHRLSYELFVGKIPEGLVIDHKCKTLCCVNPDHLEAVTQGENVRRGDAAKPRQTHCKYGHELSLRTPNAWQRTCGVCQNRRSRERRRAAKNV